ncbi:hypothetical protein ACRN97_06580 [Shewanella baltica]|uniref:hypothetical protein n=1 Tax=Shewanella baltica TaxID=62322 RepID=UPI003D7BAF53
MKILIYGEFSGYGNSLASGFKELGHTVKVFSPTGDGWKNIQSDYTLKGLSRLKRIRALLKLIPTFLGFDKVFILNPSFFSFGLLGPVFLFLFFLKKIDVSLLCCGDDVEYIRAGESGQINKYIYSDHCYPKEKYFKSVEERFVNWLCASVVKRIIPTMYDYELAWLNSQFQGKVTKVVPLACSGKVVKQPKKTNYDEIIIMHGINRPNVKGSEYIIDAINRINGEFENVKVFYPEKMPLTEYLSLFDRVDISVDQCKCHSYGMNAIYSMLHGHVVLAPADYNHENSFNITNTPIVSISADSKSIYDSLKQLINSKDLDDLKLKTVTYAVKYHTPKTVCKELLSL